MGRRGRRGAAVVAVALAAAGLAGCSSAAEPDVRAVATAFAHGGAQERCDLLAPGTLRALDGEGASCAEAVADLPVGSGEVTAVEVWGADALVHLSDDTVFLTLGDTGWQVSAAACRPAVEGPYECRLEGS